MGWRLGHTPALDGLRGVAVLLVVASHLWKPVSAWGTSGVTMFFTLSGFLITTLLIREAAATGRIDMGGFYLRRALRLLPALIAVIATCAALSAIFGGVAISTGSATIALLYAGNWVQAFGFDMGILGHTWSLAIEEQFYLAWPIVVLLMFRGRDWRRRLAWLAAAGCAYAFVARLLIWDHDAGMARIYMGSDTRMDSLLVGCLAAIWAQGRTALPRVRGGVPEGLILVALVALVLPQNSPYDYLLLPTWVPWFTAALIVGALGRPRGGALSWSWLVWVGKRSYGLYLWHAVVDALVPPRLDGAPGLVIGATVVGVSLLATAASWRFVERPFLEMKDRLRGRVVGGDPRARQNAAVDRGFVNGSTEDRGRARRTQV